MLRLRLVEDLGSGIDRSVIDNNPTFRQTRLRRHALNQPGKKSLFVAGWSYSNILIHLNPSLIPQFHPTVLYLVRPLPWPVAVIIFDSRTAETGVADTAPGSRAPAGDNRSLSAASRLR